MSQEKSPSSKSASLLLALILLFAAGAGVYYWGTSDRAPEAVREFLNRLTSGDSGPAAPAANATKIETPTAQPRTDRPAGNATAPAQLPEVSPPTAAPSAEPETAPLGQEPPAPPEEPAPVAEPEPQQPETPAEPTAPAVPIIEYNKAAPTEGPTPGVRGQVQSKKPVDTDVLFGPRSSRVEPGASLPAARGVDPLVHPAFIRDLASFLAENYWPAGTHPAAQGRGVTTAGVKLANMTFGLPLRGFGVSSESGSTSRHKVLAYVLNKEMINALYTMYGKRFFAALADAADKRRVPDAGGRPLTPAERAEMYTIYAGRARVLAGTIRAYCAAEDLQARMAAYNEAEDRAAVAYERLLHNTNAADRAPMQMLYQQAIIKRGHARELVASSLRRAGDTKGMDTDSLVYVAAWLNRRGPGKEAAFQALADLLDRVAAQFERERPALP